MSRFTGKERRPSAEARRWVYGVLSNAILTDLQDRDGWIRGGLDEFDDRRAVQAGKKVAAEMRRKADR